MHEKILACRRFVFVFSILHSVHSTEFTAGRTEKSLSMANMSSCPSILGETNQNRDRIQHMSCREKNSYLAQALRNER